jgi:hypothetical protein
MCVYFYMSGGNRERKKLHEHEAFLFAFTFIFIFGGFIFWSHGGLALDYFVGEDSISGSMDVEVETGTEKVVNLEIKKLVEDLEGDVEATVIYEFDVQCSELLLSSNQNEVNGTNETNETMIDLVDETTNGCDYVDVQLDSNTIYPGESVNLILTFLSEVNGEGEVYLSIVTDQNVDFLQFDVEFVEEVLTDDSLDEEGTEEDTGSILDILLDALQGVGDVSDDEEEEVEEEVLDDELEPIVDVQNSVGLTTSYLNFGILDHNEGQQETQVVQIENLKTESDLTFLGIEGANVAGIIVTHDIVIDQVISTGERFTFEITCIPSGEGVFAGDGLIFKTSYGDVNLGIGCAGNVVEEEIVDETPPFIEILSPEGEIQGITSVKINTYDTGGVSSLPAVLRFYLNRVLVGRVTEFPVDFSFDSSRFEDGLYILTVVSVDHAGNGGVDSGPLWINNGEANLLSVLYDSGLLDKGFEFEVDTGEGYTIFDSGTELGNEEFNLKVKYSLEDLSEDITLELKGMTLSNKLDMPFDEGDIQKITRNVWNQEIKLIDIDGDDLKTFIETTDADTIIMPMMLKENTFNDKIGFTDIPNIYYYKSDGTEPFDITGDIVSIVKVSDLEDEGIDYVLVNVEIPVRVIMEE